MNGETISILPLITASEQVLPWVETVKLNKPVCDGIPLMVNIAPSKLVITPAGIEPVKLALVAPPQTAISIASKGAFTHPV